MEEKVINILKSLTSKEEPFISLSDLLIKVNEVSEIEGESDSVHFLNDFEHTIIDLSNRGVIRVTQDLNVSLEESINEILNERKSSAIQEMEEELEKAVKEEDYEKAAEYRDMINEYKTNE